MDCTMILLALADIFIASFAILPLEVVYWCTTWEYIRRANAYPISWTLYVSIVLEIVFTLLREPLYEKKTSGFFDLCVSRLYIYVFSLVCITKWRAMFELAEKVMSLEVAIVCLVLSFLVMSKIRSVGTLVGAPYFIFLDHKRKDIFIYPTMFKKASTENVWIYLLDCVFSVCVIGMLVVFVWRGFWTMLDNFLYPDNVVYSSWMSLGIGYTIVGITFALQPPIKYLATELSGILRMAIVDVYLLFSFCGTVNVWRGIWNMQNIYLLPDNRPLSFALSHFVPFILLVLINSSNSVLVRGVYIDGEEAGSQCVDFPCYYLRLFFQVTALTMVLTKRKNKILREAAKRTEKSDRKISEGEVLIQVGVTPSIEPSWKNKSVNNFCSPELNQH